MAILDNSIRELLERAGYIVYLFDYRDVKIIADDIGAEITIDEAKLIVEMINEDKHKDANVGINNESIEIYIWDFLAKTKTEL